MSFRTVPIVPIDLAPIFAGSDRHRGAEAGLGGAEGGESDGEHLQTLPDQRTTQTVQGDSLDSDDKEY